MARWLKRVGVVFFLLAAVLFLGERAGDPALFPPEKLEKTVEITVVSHGYHAGLVLPRAAMQDVASEEGMVGLSSVLTRFSGFERLEIGWGEEGFYRHVPSLSFATLPHALKALFWPFNNAVLHVVGFSMPVEAAFPASEKQSIRLSEAGFRALLRKLESTIPVDAHGQVADLGEGLYGPSRFFRANGRFSLLNVCNHWVAGLLNAAGMRVNAALALLPAGLLLNLRFRSRPKHLATFD